MRFDKHLCLALLILVANVQYAAAQSDKVYPLRGTPTTGIVSSTTPTAVNIEVQGTPQNVPVNEIQRVVFTGEPTELSRGRDNILQGQYESGYAELRKINPTTIQRPIVKADLQFYLAYAQGKLALTGGGDKGAAAAAMLAFVRANATSFHFFQAAEMLGDLAVALGSYDNGVRYYGAIAAQAPWPDYKMRAMVSEARSLLAQEKFPEAQAKFDQVAGAQIDTPQAMQQKTLAMAGKAACLAGAGNPDEGIKVAEEIIAKNSPEESGELFGRTYNALGACYLKAGKQKDALMAYLHVDVLFYAHPEVHAEALYHLSKLWAGINKQDRAVDARNLLVDRYSGSVWAKKE